MTGYGRNGDTEMKKRITKGDARKIAQNVIFLKYREAVEKMMADDEKFLDEIYNCLFTKSQVEYMRQAEPGMFCGLQRQYVSTEHGTLPIDFRENRLPIGASHKIGYLKDIAREIVLERGEDDPLRKKDPYEPEPKYPAPFSAFHGGIKLRKNIPGAKELGDRLVATYEEREALCGEINEEFFELKTAICGMKTFKALLESWPEIKSAIPEECFEEIKPPAIRLEDIKARFNGSLAA